MASGGESESVVAKVSRQLAAIEKRDWELWLIVAVTGIVVGTGLVAMAFPAAFLGGENLRMEVEVSRESFLGLVALLILSNTYVISRRLELRKTREALISTALQSELVRLQSFTDPLTEVYNRRSLDEMAAKFISRAKRLKKPLSFIIVDADDFKEINTRFGHLTGDFVLAEIASLLKAAVRGSDAVVRYGGDEFLICLADAPAEGGEVVVLRIAKSVDDWTRAGHLPDFRLGLSLGLAEWKEEKSLDQVLNEADQKMYENKKARKGVPARSSPQDS